MAQIFTISPIAYCSIDYLTSHRDVIGIDIYDHTQKRILDLICDAIKDHEMAEPAIVSYESLEIVKQRCLQAQSEKHEQPEDMLLWCGFVACSIADTDIPPLDDLMGVS